MPLTKKMTPKPLPEEQPLTETSMPQQAIRTTTMWRFVVIVVIVSFFVGGISGAVFSQADLFSKITNAINSEFKLQKTAQNVDTKAVTVQEESQTTEVVKNANDAVVSIIITKDLSKMYDSQGLYPFDNFVQLTPPTGKQEIGGGTGFIISKDGLIVTNKHVVSDNDAEYTVLLNNRKSYAAKVTATDPMNDLAFVKIETTEDLPTLQLGDSEALQVGQTVIAIGNALGEYRNTVTKGIVSALARTVTAGDSLGAQETLDNVIQTDAAINLGNSGGPLLNLEGQVVGINTAIDSQGQLIGFAIPSSEIAKAVESVQKLGRVVRPMLGVRYVSITEELAKKNDLSVTSGALVVRGTTASQPAVVPDGPADRAGIVEDDIITEISGKKIEGEETLSRIIQQFNPGDEVTITFLHDKVEKKATVKLDEIPAS